MQLKWKIFTGLLFVLLAIVALLRFLPQKSGGDGRNYFLGVDGDPRMKACTGPKDSEHANAALLTAMKLDQPLVLNPADNADYRISVFHAGGQNAISIALRTPKKGTPAIANIATFKNGTVKFETQNIIYEQAVALINSLEGAKIWGPMKTTFEPRKNIGPASAIIEVQSPTTKRCLSTRYDDERIKPLLHEFANRIKSVAQSTDISGFEPVAQEVFGKKVK